MPSRLPLLAVALAHAAVIPAADHGHDHDHDHGHAEDHEAHGEPAASTPSPPGRVRLTSIGAITQIAVGGSTGNSEELEWSQTGAHDPHRYGFNLQQLELSVSGAVDPYFRAASHILYTEDHGVELEEAYAVTTSLPRNLEVEAGLMLSEFGFYNHRHSHEYAHIDQPLVIGSLIGSEGMRGLGVRGAWRGEANTLHLSVQNGDHETMTSFLGEGHSHGDEHGHEEEGEHGHDEGLRQIENIEDLLWTARWTNRLPVRADQPWQLGVSAAIGPNPHDEQTVLAGVDLSYRTADHDHPLAAGDIGWITEFVLRDVGADEHDEDTQDWGVVSTLLYGIDHRWSAGLRLDYVELDHHEDEHEDEHEEEGDHADHVPAERLRVSPLLRWQPSSATEVRLQYNWTSPDDGDDVHSVWLGLEVHLGTGHVH